MGFFCYFIPSDLITINGNWSGLNIEFMNSMKIKQIFHIEMLKCDGLIWQLCISDFGINSAVDNITHKWTKSVTCACRIPYWIIIVSLISVHCTVYIASLMGIWTFRLEFRSQQNDKWLSNESIFLSLDITSLPHASIRVCKKKNSAQIEKKKIPPNVWNFEHRSQSSGAVITKRISL